MRKKINKLNRKKIKNLISFFINELQKRNKEDFSFIYPYRFIYYLFIEKKLNLQSYSILLNLFYRLKTIKKGQIEKKEFYTILNNL